MITYAVLKDDFIEMTKLRVATTWAQEQDEPGAMYNIQIQVGGKYLISLDFCFNFSIFCSTNVVARIAPRIISRIMMTCCL